MKGKPSSKPIIVVVAIMTVIVLAVIFFYVPSELDEKDLKVHVPEMKSNTPSEIVYNQISPKSKAIEFDPVIWRANDNVANMPHLRSDITDAEPVSYERNLISNLSIGSTIEVLIPQLNESLSILITSSNLLSSGNVSFKGHLISDQLFSFVMTLGKNTMFATIGTPEGIYNVSGNKDSAWVIPAASLKKQMNTDILDYRSKSELEIRNENLPSSGNR